MRGKAEYPEIGDLVVSTVQNVKNFGAFVSLDEYGGKEGFIHITEVATGWVKYIRDYVREGQKIVCKVLAVDPSKEHVDLSLKVINDHQRREKIHAWKDEQKAEKLLELVAKKLNMAVEQCITDEVYEKLIETYGTLFRAFEESVINKKSLDDAGFKGDWVKEFVGIAEENIEPPFVHISGCLEIQCYKPDGISHIKTALSQIEKKLGKDGSEVTVKYVGAPKYRVSVKAKNYKAAEDIITKASDKAITYITKHDGEGKFTREAKK
jgi:translation initiation factor 2 subunit 1